MRRLDERIRRSKRRGKISVVLVLVVSLVLGSIMSQALALARSTGQNDLVTRATFGIGLLVLLNLFSVTLAWRQHRLLDKAGEEMNELVRGPVIPTPSGPKPGPF
jgi:hypothetical protein